ncbi:diaminopimelate epimerase [Chondrinema litorale]|uniref:diaminopimelate epimerase n=1 Tax=Chondrinema litorale TaxID=2994555 RepID=UPI002542A2D1|nr:diaminopimelate epimerase [Chondrinema litorale]UZR95506.1 diaminopimelate epimerase [Chondrinema litorale]
MKINFFKYQGTGNDFVMIDDRNEQFDKNNQALVASLCQRRFGIGADGLILLRKHDTTDFEMVYFNADGKEGSLCGNGGRCTVQFAYDLEIFKEHTTFLAADGLHEAYIKDGLVALKMGNVDSIDKISADAFADTGSPHYLKYVNDIENFPVYSEGKSIRHSYRPEGTNVNFLEILGEELFVRTFERGVEDETWSCGTGVTAAALFASEKMGTNNIAIKTKGGSLNVSFEKNDGRYENIYLTGPAKKVFFGSIEI